MESIEFFNTFSNAHESKILSPFTIIFLSQFNSIFSFDELESLLSKYLDILPGKN